MSAVDPASVYENDTGRTRKEIFTSMRIVCGIAHEQSRQVVVGQNAREATDIVSRETMTDTRVSIVVVMAWCLFSGLATVLRTGSRRAQKAVHSMCSAPGQPQRPTARTWAAFGRLMSSLLCANLVKDKKDLV